MAAELSIFASTVLRSVIHDRLDGVDRVARRFGSSACPFASECAVIILWSLACLIGISFQL